MFFTLFLLPFSLFLPYFHRFSTFFTLFSSFFHVSGGGGTLLSQHGLTLSVLVLEQGANCECTENYSLLFMSLWNKIYIHIILQIFLLFSIINYWICNVFFFKSYVLIKFKIWWKYPSPPPLWPTWWSTRWSVKDKYIWNQFASKHIF